MINLNRQNNLNYTVVTDLDLHTHTRYKYLISHWNSTDKEMTLGQRETGREREREIKSDREKEHAR